MFGESFKQLAVMFVIALVAIYVRNHSKTVQNITG
jgi:hypothetical protein